MNKPTHEITLRIPIDGTYQTAQSAMYKVARLLHDSGFDVESQIHKISEPKPPASLVQQFKYEFNHDSRLSDMDNRRLSELILAPTEQQKIIADRLANNVGYRLVPETTISEAEDRTVYLMTSGASVFYGFEPFTGKLDAMKRITVSQMHPHYSNPLEVANELESIFKSLGATVIRSVYTDSKVL